MDYVVVAYYTRDTGYEVEVKKLEASLEQLHLSYDITPIKNQGSWQKNTHFKPYFIRQMLFKHFPKDIVYVDADAVFRSYPILFDNFNHDIGFVIYRNNELFSGTLYLANNPGVYDLLDSWQELCFNNQEIFEQRLLHQALIKHKDRLNLLQLPFNYCKIFDDPQIADPVIEQFQASRKLKEEIDRT